LIEYSIKPGKGSEGKSDCAASIGGMSSSIPPLLAFRKAQRGREKIRIEEIIEHPRPSQEEIRALGLQAI
jgi:hypothetical protein